MQPNDAIEFHSLATLFPPLDDAAFEALTEDIREHGLREDIWLYEGKILDGTHRHKACLAVGVEPRFRHYEGDSPLAFVIGVNLHRRHLTMTQRAMVAARVMAEFEAEARTNMSRGGQGLADLPTLNSRDRAAELVGVSSRLVGAAAQILGRGVPELVAAVERDAIKIAAAAAVATLENAELAELVARGPKAVRQRAAQLRMTTKTKVEGGPSTEDRDYLESCPVRVRLADPALFDRQALILHRLRPVLERLGREFPEAFEDGAWRGPIGAFASTRLDRLMFVRDARKWTLCTFCMGTGTEQGERRCSICEGGGFEVQCHDPSEARTTSARAPASDGRRIGRRRKE